MLCSCSLRVLASVRLKISPLAANRVFYSDDTKKQKNEWSSILGDPKVQSPFSNPNRKNASPFRDSQAQAFLNELKDADEKENPATLNSTKASEIPPLKTVEFKVHDDEKVKKFLDETSKEFVKLHAMPMGILLRTSLAANGWLHFIALQTHYRFGKVI